MVIVIWVFTRSMQLLNVYQSLEGNLEHPAVADAFQQQASGWKAEMHPESRDYGINTLRLDQGKPTQYMFRAVDTVAMCLERLKARLGYKMLAWLGAL